MKPEEYTKTIKITKTLVKGYQIFCDYKHPLANSNRWIYYHRHLASIKIGRWLLGSDIVHHIDNNRLNNNLNNLVITTHTGHSRYHTKESITNICKYCGKPYKLRPRKHRAKVCSLECKYLLSRKVDRPNKETLELDIKTLSWVAIGKKYGVSDNAIRKWAHTYGLL